MIPLIATSEEDSLTNEQVFYCPREELVELLAQHDFGKSANYRIMVAIPPEREKTKGGIIITKQAAEDEQQRTSIGRVLSIGSTVGDNPSLRDCKDLRIGD
jgi:hypothetical protein